jgi:transposase-like protein
MRFITGLVCKGCLADIPLPIANPPYASEMVPCWPESAAPYFFLCLKCNHIFEYSADCLLLIPFPTAAKKGANAVFCLEVTCSENTCTSLLRIQLVSPRKPDPFRRIFELIPKITSGERVHCERGHIQNFGGRLIFDLYTDPRWSTREQMPAATSTTLGLHPYFLDVATHFTSDAECMSYLESLRWPNSVSCPFCDSRRVSITVRRKPNRNKLQRFWQCLSCRGQFLATTGTVFQGSHLSLTQWFAAVALFVVNPRLSAYGLKKLLSLRTNRSASYMVLRISRSISVNAQRRP